MFNDIMQKYLSLSLRKVLSIFTEDFFILPNNALSSLYDVPVLPVKALSLIKRYDGAYNSTVGMLVEFTVSYQGAFLSVEFTLTTKISSKIA